MKDFNNFEDAIKASIPVNGRRGPIYHIMAKRGDITTYRSTSSRKWRSGGYVETVFEKPSDRKLESDKHSNGDVLIYDPSNMFLGWKNVYINSKGSYFKKHGKSYYI